MSYSKELAGIALEIGAIKLNPDEPFTWASGYRMPVYNDNRLLLGNPDHRLLVAKAFESILQRENIAVDVIAGVATAGISHATTLANRLETPLIYVRPQPKAHGMKNQIEGILKEGQKVVVIEDLISTGGSAVTAVKAIRVSGGIVEHCLCIFSYGFDQAEATFSEVKCRIHSLLTFKDMIGFAREKSVLAGEKIKLLQAWHQNPFQWGDRHGFPKMK